MRIIFNLFCLILFLVEFSLAQYSPEDLLVDVPDLGRIRGDNRTTYSENGITKPYIHFTGIPYAKMLARFQPSEINRGPLAPDGEEFDATNATRNILFQCPQLVFGNTMGHEECLNINVYTAKKYDGNDSALRPVILYIHGGAFTVGSGSSYSGIRFLLRDIVYVSFNYRLGLLGWFTLQNDIIPGNSGLYDVLNALKWTKDYIKYFGGDPNRITIAGQSAGSALVTHLLTSPLVTEGMFHGAIAASGSSLNAWGTAENNLKESLKITEMVGCYNSTENTEPDIESLSICMLNVSTSSLVQTLYNYQVSERTAGRLGDSAAAPVVQNFAITHPKIITNHPEEVFNAGMQVNVPLLMGTTKHDGSFVLGLLYHRMLRDSGLHNDTNFLKNELIPTILQSFGMQDKPFGVYETIGKTYLSEDARLSGDFMKMCPGLIDIFSVFFFKGESYNTALKHSKLNSSTFWYSFNFAGSSSLFSQLFPYDGKPPFNGGITHGDDLMYMFGLTFSQFTESESRVSSLMLDYWTNFAATGNPTPDDFESTIWPVLNSTDQKYLEILEEPEINEFYTNSWVDAGLDTIPVPTTDPTITTTVLMTSPQGTDSTSATESSPAGTSTESSSCINHGSLGVFGFIIVLFSTIRNMF